MVNRTIGLHLQNNSIRAVELYKKADSYFLQNFDEFISEGELTQNFDLLTDGIDSLISQRGFKGKTINIALDIRNVFIQSIPLREFNKGNEIKKLIEWELKQFFPGEDIRNYRYDTYRIPGEFRKDKTQIVVYTVISKPYIRMIQAVIKRLKLNLNSIFIDHFIVKSLFKVLNDKEDRDEYITICFQYDDVIYCSLLKSTHLLQYREYSINQSNLSDNGFDVFPKVINDNNLNKRVYYYPDSSVDESIKTIFKGWETELINPFRRFTKSRHAKRKIDSNSYNEEMFAPAAAAALTGIA